MRRSTFSLLAAAFLLAAPVCAQESEWRKLPLRVSSTAAGAAVMVDRGARDRVEEGDPVMFFPRSGGSYRGVVRKVDDRSSLVELVDQRFIPELGTRGEVAMPASRFAPTPEDPEPEQPDAQQEPDDPERWSNQDEEYEEGMPLLAQVRPVHPEDREMSFRGRMYLIGDLVHVPEDGTSDSFVRGGADVQIDNPFGRGGGLRAHTEFALLTEQDDDTSADILPRRMSYYWGGTRFSDHRWEIGRFLQNGMPEFGILDGIEWGTRREDGDRMGASFGFMPELDEDFESFQDLQAAVYYLWSADERETLTFGGGYQKTLHSGKTDRDLLIVKTRYQPDEGWDLHGTAWIDFYYGRDDIKGTGVELTQALASASRRWRTGSSVSFTYSRQRFPEILRTGEFLPLQAPAIADNRYDRLAFDWQHVGRTGTRLHGHVAGWNDEEDSGGSADLGLDVADVFMSRSRNDFVLFGVAGQFTTDAGARVSVSRFVDNGQWDFLYEIAFRHNSGFPSDADDFLQHRVRVSRTIYSGEWNVNLHADGYVWDDDIAGSVGFYLQRSF